jgi:hypothetical protein
MGKLGSSAEALIEILNLCEQTLTALKADYDEALRPLQTDQNCLQSDQNRRQEPRRSTKLVRRLFLIRGGLSRTDQQLSAR